MFSYDEDDMVENPQLATHLAHFGINITQMEKVFFFFVVCHVIVCKVEISHFLYFQTEKSMIELELDLNQKLSEWGTYSEAVPVYGPGRTGEFLLSVLTTHSKHHFGITNL